MESPDFMVILVLGMLFQSVFAFPFAARNDGVQGSRLASRSCGCQSVEVWLRRYITSSSELPSFEELTSNRVSLLVNGEQLGKRLLLRPQKNCNLLLKKADGVSSITSRNVHDGSMEVWLVKDHSHCLSIWMKCQERLICVGLDVDSSDFIQLTKRKLLMIADGHNHEEITGFRVYSLVFSGLVLCVLVILVALCGLHKRTSHSEIYSGDEDVKVVKSKNVESVRQKDHSESEDVVKQENQENLATQADQIEDVVIDRNSNNRSSKTSIDLDLDAVGMADKNHNENEGDRTDDQVCVNEPQNKGKISKEKEKGNLKSKRKDKDMRSKRAHTTPEPKSSTSKISRLSLKIHSNTENQKKSKKKSSSEGATPPSSPPERFAANGNRRSFVDRELPQCPIDELRAVPTADENYSVAFDSKRVTDDDIEEDTNYEQVRNGTTADVSVSARDEIRRFHRGSSSTPATQPRISITIHQDDEILYDSVDEQKVMQSSGTLDNQSRTADDSDTYESVQEWKEKTPNAETFEEMYEVVDKRNSQGHYDDANLSRKRSFSDVTSPSSMLRESGGPKTKSLERGAMAATRPPPPPTLENLQSVAMLRQASHDNDDDVIDPYTVTRISGDYIVQETSTNTVLFSDSMRGNSSQTVPVSKEQLEMMYAKVDKNKRQRDRLASQAEKEKQKEQGVVDSDNKTNTADKPSTNGCVSDEDENNYETIPTLPRNHPKLPVEDGEDSQHQDKDKMVMV